MVTAPPTSYGATPPPARSTPGSSTKARRTVAPRFPPAYRLPGRSPPPNDVGGDAVSDVLWRNTATGAGGATQSQIGTCWGRAPPCPRARVRRGGRCASVVAYVLSDAADVLFKKTDSPPRNETGDKL